MHEEDDAVREIMASQAKWAAGLKEIKQKDKVAASEEKWAAGFTKAGGKYVPADGLVARSGRRRILPNVDDWKGGPQSEEDAKHLARVASDVLHGRSATVFERRVINPLLGLPQCSVEELAAQFGVSTSKIYEIIERCKARVAKAFKERAAPKTDSGRCPTCGRIYAEWNFSQCARNGPLHDESLRRGLSGPSWEIPWRTLRWPPRHLHPECLPQRYWSDAAALQKKYLSRFSAI